MAPGRVGLDRLMIDLFVDESYYVRLKEYYDTILTRTGRCIVKR